MAFKPDQTNRSFRWGFEPQFSRGLLLGPPTDPEPMPDVWQARSTRIARRNRPALIAGITVSVLMHGVAVAVWRGASPSADAFASTADRAVATELRVIELAPAPAVERMSPAIEAYTPDARPVPALASAVEVRVLRASTEPGQMHRTLVTGAARTAMPELHGGGSDAGDMEAAGEEGPRTVVVSRARSVLRTWKPPRSVIGLEILVRLHVDERGRPTGPVELQPPTPDEETNQELIYRARNLDYVPAFEDGEPAQGWAEISYRFCHDGVAAASPPSPTFGRGNPCERRGEEDMDVSDR